MPQPSSRRAGWVGKFVVALASVIATVILFDAVAYFVVPSQYTTFAVSYRHTELLHQTSRMPAMAWDYPRGYFMADDEMGFDMKPGARARYQFEGPPLDIWVNSLGCFDRNERADFQAGEYYYFAGDSFTWGFAAYDNKFPTVWEKLTGKKAAKCGITHSGQFHQLAKFHRFVAALGKLPKMVFVGFYVNDPANDEAYPHSTVVDGYLTDMAFLRGGRIVHPPIDERRRAVEQSIRAMMAPPTPVDRVKTFVWVFSLSANMADQAIIAARKALERRASTFGNVLASAGSRSVSAFGDNLYYWYDDASMKTRYADDPATARNRAAILEWKEDARTKGYRLVFLLIPPKSNFNDADFFGQVRGWLAANGIEYLDFAQVFKQGGYDIGSLYWKVNGHWNDSGNRIVGRVLAERYPAR